MRTPKEGAVYEMESADEKFVCVGSPDTFGVPTHEAENMKCEFESVEDGEWMSVPVDNFGRGWTKVADSVERFEKQDEDGLTEDEREEIQDRARESWGRLAREFGITEDDVREIIVG